MTEEVLTLAPGDHCAKLYDLLETEHIRHVPIVGPDGTLVGLATQRDLLREMLSGIEWELPISETRKLLRSRKISDIMLRDVATAEPDDDLAEVATMILENKIGCVPVVDGGLLVGILTEADFVSYFVPDSRVSTIARVSAPLDLEEAPEPLQARVINGHLVLHEPIDLPEGTVVDLLIADRLEELEEDLASRRPNLDADSAIAHAGGDVRSGDEAIGVQEGD